MRESYHKKILNVGGILVTIARRPIKNINIYIKPPNGEVLVTAPRLMSEERILAFVEEKAEWIRVHQKRMQERGAKGGALQEKETRTVSEEQKAWLKERISFYAQKWEPVMGVHCVCWTIRDMTSRWGSCSVQKHTIRINLQLAHKPEECLEYVIVHELAHLLEPSHNKRFHAYMKQFLPDYKEREKVLKESGGC